tara:strand:+ start:261 stop:464 length:204 start_codon:yes stop_codon:yes gene_type:complete
MSLINVDSIGEQTSGNGISLDNVLKLKSLTTTQRDALTASAGMIIFNSTTSKINVYSGSAWEEVTSS